MAVDILPGETIKRVLVVDDDARVRHALRSLIEGSEGLTVSGEASSAREAMRVDEASVADVVLLDVFLPSPEDGLYVIAGLVERGRCVVALSIRGDYRRAALDAGAAAFVDKGAGPDVLVEALRRCPSVAG